MSIAATATATATAPVVADRHTPSATYKTLAAEKADKAALKPLAGSLMVPDHWLRLDGYGCWHISGPTGHIYAYSSKARWLGGYLVVCHPGSGHEWSRVKAKLGGVVRQDGDDEGVILIDRGALPPMGELRRAIGCRTR